MHLGLVHRQIPVKVGVSTLTKCEMADVYIVVEKANERANSKVDHSDALTNSTLLD